MRVYLLSAGQHGVAAFPPSRSIGQQMNNPLDYRWVMRTLLVSMNRWVDRRHRAAAERATRASTTGRW